MKVAIAGYGLEGKVSAVYWQGLGADVTVLDEKPVTDVPADIRVLTGPKVFDDISSYDMVVRTASLRPDKLATAQRIWSATNEFFARCPAPIIGVTGTKGKGTTSSFTASILRAAGRTVHLVGNIGVPALEELPKITSQDVVVFELSSFQLWDLEKSPHVAVVLMVEPDHQDVHHGMEEYIAAKSHIAAHQTPDDVVIYHGVNEYSRAIASVGQGKKVRYLMPDDGGVYVNEDHFCVQGDPICSVAALQIPGWHNIENACAAITAARVDNPAMTIAQIETGLRQFSGLPHRLRLVREVDGVRYYDDNYSSAPGAAVAAMRAFSEPEVLIMGGYDKQVDLANLAKAIADQPNIKKVILMGQTRYKIASALDTLGRSDLYDMDDSVTLQPVVEHARALAAPGDVVVMSPACASFDMFKNFGDRGDQFTALVKAL